MMGAVTTLLECIGENATREGLLDTPMRVAKAMQFLTSGYDQHPEDILRSALFTETSATVRTCSLQNT